ncbi:zinc-ribbon domain-containing protein [Proteiniborus sp. MB09-C3]
MKGDYNICPYCGASLSVKCHNCGTAIEDDWLVCPRCAKPLKENV